MKWHLKLFLYHYTPIITHWQQMRQNPSDTLSENLQNTWRSQEQIAREKATTQQQMQSLQEQLSYTQSNQASIDTNWNDKVLDAAAAKHNLAGKEEALAYLNNHGSEGEEILRGLIDEKYQNNMPSPITHRQKIQDHANSGISDIPDDYQILSKSMEDKYMAQNHDHEDFKSNIEGSLSEVENKAQTAQKIEEAQQKAEQAKIREKAKFDDTSNSTVIRAGGEVFDNAKNILSKNKSD